MILKHLVSGAVGLILGLSLVSIPHSESAKPPNCFPIEGHTVCISSTSTWEEMDKPYHAPVIIDDVVNTDVATTDAEVLLWMYNNHDSVGIWYYVHDILRLAPKRRKIIVNLTFDEVNTEVMVLNWMMDNNTDNGALIRYLRVLENRHPK